MRNLLISLFVVFASQIVAQDFEVFVSDAGNFNNPPWQILKFDKNGENPEVFIDQELNWPQDILFLEKDNIVLISNLGTGTINRHHPSTGAFIDNFASSIGGPTRIKIGPDSLIYVLQWSGNGKVKRYQLDGSYVDDFTSMSVEQSIGLDWDAEDNLYVSSYKGKHVRKFDIEGIDQGLFIESNLAGPTTISFDAQGDLLISDYNGTTVKRFSADGNYINDFLTGLGKSEGVAYLDNGNILIGNGSSKSVKSFDSDGNSLGDFISSSAGNLLNPNAVVIREKQTTKVIDKNVGNDLMISPNIGTEFIANSHYSSEIKQLDIFTSTGNFLDSLIISNGASFNAAKYGAGNYLVRIRFKDGAFKIEHIVVKLD